MLTNHEGNKHTEEQTYVFAVSHIWFSLTIASSVHDSPGLQVEDLHYVCRTDKTMQCLGLTVPLLYDHLIRLTEQHWRALREESGSRGSITARWRHYMFSCPRTKKQLQKCGRFGSRRSVDTQLLAVCLQ